MQLTDEDRDLLELCIQAQVAQIAFGCKITGADSALMVDAVQKLEKIAEKVRTAADVRENKHGKWIKYPSGELICSNCCHRRVKNALGDRWHWFALPKFCEACGAIMDGGKEK